MKSLFDRFFGRSKQLERWYHVIWWWELRRIPYNLLLLLSGLVSLIVFHNVVNGAMDFIHPFTPYLFGFLANVFYTFGWIVELGIRLLFRTRSRAFPSKAFAYGLAFSIFCTFLPTIVYAAFAVITGEKASSPYYHFTSEEPRYNDLVGDYVIEQSSIKGPQGNIESITKARILLRDDGSLVVTNVPIDRNGLEFEILTGRGRWSLSEPSSFHAWTVGVRVDSVVSPERWAGNGFGMPFFVYNHKPPYDLYIIFGDPDSWDGVRFRRKSDQ